MFYVYLLKSKNNRTYIGYTSDLRRRMEEHNKESRRGYQTPFTLIYYEAYQSESDAIEREKALKQFGNAYKQLKRRIKNSLLKTLKVRGKILILVLVIGGMLGFGLTSRNFQGTAQEELPIFEYKEFRKPPAEKFVADEIIVKFKPGITKDLIDNFLHTQETLEKYESKFAKFKVLKIPAIKNVPELVEIFKKSPLVEYAEPNYYVYATMVPNDPYYIYQWHFDILPESENPDWHGANGGGINLEPAWDISTGTTSVVVAVVDTGVAYEDYSDPNPASCYDRFGQLKTCRPTIDTYYRAPDLVNTSFLILPGSDIVNNDDHPNDDEGHGTHVTGTVAQSTNNELGVAGVAFHTTVMPVKVLDANGSGLSDGVADGIYFATDNGAKIINLSLGSSNPSTTIENAVAYAYNQGVTVIAASGNDGTSPVIYPAGYDNYVIAVGATQYDETRAPYSNYGSSLDIVAPGGNTGVDQNGDGYGDGVLQQTFGADTSDFGYWFYQGTSMAAPHISGLAALLLAQNSNRTPDQIRSILQNTAEDKGASGWDQYYGYGIVDAYAALTYTPGVSISLTTNGSVNFGTLLLNTTQDTTGSGINDVETVKIDIGPASLDIKSSAFSNGSNTWNFGSFNGDNQVKWEFSKEGTTWATFLTPDLLYDLENNVPQNETRNIYLRLTMPTASTSMAQHNSTVTVVATAP